MPTDSSTPLPIHIGTHKGYTSEVITRSQMFDFLWPIYPWFCQDGSQEVSASSASTTLQEGYARRFCLMGSQIIAGDLSKPAFQYSFSPHHQALCQPSQKAVGLLESCLWTPCRYPCCCTIHRLTGASHDLWTHQNFVMQLYGLTFHMLLSCGSSHILSGKFWQPVKLFGKHLALFCSVKMATGTVKKIRFAHKF